MQGHGAHLAAFGRAAGPAAGSTGLDGGTNTALTRWRGVPPAVLGTAANICERPVAQVDHQALATDHVFRAREHHRALQGHQRAVDVVDAEVALRGLLGRGQEDMAAGLDPADRAGGVAAAASVAR